MKKYKSILKPITIGLIGVMAISNTLPAFATEHNENGQSTHVIGTFEATLLDVKVPAVSTFVYNPNTEQLTTQIMTVESNTNAPIYMNLEAIHVAEESEWKPELISPETFTTEEWRNLTQRESKKQISLGVSALKSDQWLFELNNEQLWSVDVKDNPKFGTIRNHGEVKMKPTLQSGNSIPAEDGLIANYIFEFGLEQGEMEQEEMEQEEIGDSKEFEININEDILIDSNGQITLDATDWIYDGDREKAITNEKELYIGSMGSYGLYMYNLPSGMKTATFELKVKNLSNGGGMNSSMFIRTIDTGIGFYFYPDKIEIYDDVFGYPIKEYYLDGTEYNTYRIVKENEQATIYVNGENIGSFTLIDGSGYGEQMFFFGDGTSSSAYSETYYKDIKIAPGKALYLD